MTTQLTTSQGAPIPNTSDSLTVGRYGPVCLNDVVFVEQMAHFNREKIQERPVHAKGAGAYGTFVVTNDVSQYTKADMYNGVGKQTKVFVRFSTSALESGSADTVRDVRGMAIKFYTGEGNYDLLCISFPIFFVKDSMKFFHLNHATRRDPVTHLPNPNAFWDFMTQTPESAYAVMNLFADKGIPDGYRYMEAYGCHAFKFVNADGAYVYCKFQITPVNGERFLTSERATELAGSQPDYATRDLYESIENGDFPKWDVQVQIMTQEQADNLGYNPFDITKELPEEQFPLITIGQITLDQNPVNFFEYVEQSAFSPSNLVSGIEGAPDKAFDGRTFAYPDAQRARLGPNFPQLKVNRPIVEVNNYQQDGLMTCHYQVGPTNYYPNTTGGPEPNPIYKETVYNVCGDVDRYSSFGDDHFSQAKEFYQLMEEDEKGRLVKNLGASIFPTRPEIKQRALEFCGAIDPDLAARVTAEVNP